MVKWVIHKVTSFQCQRKIKGKRIGVVHKHIIPSNCYSHDQRSMPNSCVVKNIPHPTVSDGLTHERSVGINKPRSAMLGVIHNFYPKTIY